MPKPKYKLVDLDVLRRIHPIRDIANGIYSSRSYEVDGYNRAIDDIKSKYGDPLCGGEVMNYYNEFHPPAAAILRGLIADKLIPEGHVDDRSIEDVQSNDLKGYTSAISSRGSADGRTPCNSQDGQQIDLFGQDRAPASRSAPAGRQKVKPTSVTYGPSGTASSESVGLQSCLENRLRQRLPMDGLTMFIKGWRQKVTPSGRQYCQLAVLARPINATDCGLWPPNYGQRAIRERGASTFGDRKNNGENILTGQVKLMWPTPMTSDQQGQGYSRMFNAG